ncbi:MAG: glucose-1-phosphate adenylyltransferase subunit GlgD [Clostridia bacterium]|nr:glucose-1-phosphate adenylyltransferase subunit GlgD [Clostridia bacterium]MBQ5772744.1 glucose-1-phosphate adenylyltransferase subunit GlgD [Clostridia bacterium]
MTIAGLIFSNIHDNSIPEMTRRRTIASIPYGCRYRLIDFALSNMVNSGITNVGIVTHYNYQSLLDHVGNGKDWDLARRSGGIKLLPPYVAAYENTAAGKLYENRLEALMGVGNFINRCGAEYLVLSDCDSILNIDLKKVVEDHVASGAYVTIVTKKLEAGSYRFEQPVPVLKVDENNRITDLADYCPEKGGEIISTNIMVISRADLQTVVAESLARGHKSFHKDILAKNLKKKVIRAYPFEGWYSVISSLDSYYQSSMDLLKSDVRRDLFRQAERRIYTKVRNSAPTRYVAGAIVQNSLVADGCVIEGTVENSILFRGVHVGRGTVVKNCILLQDTYVGSGVSLNCVIADKNVVIKDERNLSGHESMPFFIDKNVTV